jgi:DNA-binding transcriptional MerR regulator
MEERLMPSSEVKYLRDVAKTQARIYREHVKKLNRLRNDDYMEMEVKNQKMKELLASTREQYAQLERDAKAKAAAIQSRVIAKTAPTDIARQDIRYMLGKNMSLHEIGRFAQEQNRPELLAAMREIAPMMAAAHDLPNQGKTTTPEHALRDAMNAIESYERQFATPQEQAMYDERREVEAGIGHLEGNFKAIVGNLQIHERAGTVQLERLNNWPGLPGDGQYQGPISLAEQDNTPAPASWVPGRRLA